MAAAGKGQRLKEHRKSRGMSQKTMALFIGTSLRQYGRWEREQNDWPVSLLELLTHEHGLDPTWLLTGQTSVGVRSGVMKLLGAIDLAMERANRPLGDAGLRGSLAFRHLDSALSPRGVRDWVLDQEIGAAIEQESKKREGSL